MILTFSYLTSWEMVFPFLGITTKIRKKGSSYTESKLHLFFFNSLFFDAFWMNSQLHCWMALTVLDEEWLHRCVMTQSTPGNFLPRKITLNLKLHFSLTTSLHFTWLDCNMLLMMGQVLDPTFRALDPTCGDRYSKIYIFGVGKWFFW